MNLVSNDHGTATYYFIEGLIAQVGKEAAIIDERYNGGGDIADYIIDYLRRSLLSYWSPREGTDITTPTEAIFGPKVMITNRAALRRAGPRPQKAGRR